MTAHRTCGAGGWARRALTALLLAVLACASIRPARAEDGPHRSPGLAFLLSALLPGAGQLYLGQHRGYVYLGIEAATWFTRAAYLEAGNNKEGEYEAFARRHWSYNLFHGSAGDEGSLWTAEKDSLILWFEQHDLQQYYEEIGKYDWYRTGWDDFAANYDPENEALTPNRVRYRDLRQKSNDLLDKARLALAGAVLNRVVSGVDAFRSARSRNEREPELRLEGGLEGSFDEPRAVVRLVRILP